MPSKDTFTIKPIKELLDKYFNPNEHWVDPFAGLHSPAHVKNDLNPDILNAQYHLDALEFLNQFPANTFDGCFYDPPYSVTQAAQCYKSHGKDLLTSTVTNWKYWKLVKEQIANITKPGGLVLSFGWSSQGIGINRDFQMVEILLVPHGGGHNDTLVTVERKNKEIYE